MKCINCGKEAKEQHHIIPLSLGGNDIETNKVWLCSECHAIVHGFNKERRGTHWKELQAAGIAAAKKKGEVKFGRPKVEKPNNWDEVIKRWEAGEIKAVEAMEELGLKKATFYRKLKEGW